MQDAADSDRPETWTFFFYISWYSTFEEQERMADWTNAQPLQQVKEFSRAFTDPWKSSFEWVDDDRKVWYICLNDFDPGADGHRWDNHGGRVTLAGDAYHDIPTRAGTEPLSDRCSEVI